jgi:hypothetical protein
VAGEAARRTFDVVGVIVVVVVDLTGEEELEALPGCRVVLAVLERSRGLAGAAVAGEDGLAALEAALT